jgi:hypothetical protein
MTVDPTTDPFTGITSFQQTSATCVRFTGVGRVNGATGGAWPFYLDACDNASSGTGFDTFTITVPDLDGQGKTFRESGTLTSGDIALGGSSTPTTGTLTVTTTTTGANLDPDGYTVTVDGANSTSIADNGSQSFANLSSGSHSVTLSGVAANCTVSGGTSQTATVPAGGSTSVAFQVNCVAPPATQLAFTVQPSNTETSTSISPAVKVTALDANGNAATSFNGSMTMAIGQNPGGGTLSGTRTVTAVNGVGTFSDLKIDRAGNGYTLQVGASGLTGAASAQFNVKQKPLICVLGICM